MRVVVNNYTQNQTRSGVLMRRGCDSVSRTLHEVLHPWCARLTTLPLYQRRIIPLPRLATIFGRASNPFLRFADDTHLGCCPPIDQPPKTPGSSLAPSKLATQGKPRLAGLGRVRQPKRHAPSHQREARPRSCACYFDTGAHLQTVTKLEKKKRLRPGVKVLSTVRV